MAMRRFNGQRGIATAETIVCVVLIISMGWLIADHIRTERTRLQRARAVTDAVTIEVVERHVRAGVGQGVDVTIVEYTDKPYNHAVASRFRAYL
jgi:hypothetical protein